MQRYFLKSPFRSYKFLVSTAVLIVFLIWAFHIQNSMEARKSCVSGAVLEVALFPPLAWVYALLLHWEIRGMARLNIELPQNSRLSQLHEILVPMTILLSSLIIVGMKLTCSRV